MPAQKKFRDSIHAKGTEITVLSTGDSNDYISLTVLHGTKAMRRMT